MRDWHHAPVHRLTESGAYFVTAGTLTKRHFFNSKDRLDALQDELFAKCARYEWTLQAWAIFSNHYHFVALSPDDPGNLKQMLSHLHGDTCRLLNRLDDAEGRRVWFQYWETALTYQRSYLARLRYVHENAVKHGLVREAAAYPWCSAGWFEREAEPSFRRMLASFQIDRVNVRDDWDAALPVDT